MRAAATHARLAVLARCTAESPLVITRYVGITAIGSTIKRSDVSVISANWRTSAMRGI